MAICEHKPKQRWGVITLKGEGINTVTRTSISRKAPTLLHIYLYIYLILPYACSFFNFVFVTNRQRTDN